MVEQAEQKVTVTLEVQPSGNQFGPVLQLALNVDLAAGQGSGRGEVTQFARPSRRIDSLTGSVTQRQTGSGGLTLHLIGESMYFLLPPAIGVEREQMTIDLEVDESWNGTGAFYLGGMAVPSCVVKANQVIVDSN